MPKTLRDLFLGFRLGFRIMAECLGEGDDLGPVAGPLAGRVRRGAAAGEHHQRLPPICGAVHQTRSGGQADHRRDGRPHPKAIYQTPKIGPAPGAPGAGPQAVGQHGPPHPHHAPPTPWSTAWTSRPSPPFWAMCPPPEQAERKHSAHRRQTLGGHFSLSVGNRVVRAKEHTAETRFPSWFELHFSYF